MTSVTEIIKQIDDLERHLAALNREYEFARSRMITHSERATMRERIFYAGARLRMEELNEEREQAELELEELNKERLTLEWLYSKYNPIIQAHARLFFEQMQEGERG